MLWLVEQYFCVERECYYLVYKRLPFSAILAFYIVKNTHLSVASGHEARSKIYTFH